jgi:hypothetical protein
MRRLATGSRFRHREERSDAPIQRRRLGPSSLNRFACARDDKRAMGDVAIVARVLDHANSGEIGVKLMGRERDSGLRPFGSATGTGSGNVRQQRFENRPRCAAGAGHGCPAASGSGHVHLGRERWRTARRSISQVVKA